MFFDTLESRCLCSVSIPSNPVSIPADIQLPKAIVANLHAARKKTVVASAATTAAAARSKALVTAVLRSEIQFLSDVIAGKLKNLKQDLTDLRSNAVKAGKNLQTLLGSNVQITVNMPTSQLDAIRGLGGATDHLGELIGTQADQLTGSKNSQVSEDPGESKGLLRSIIDFFTPSSPESAGTNAANYGLDVGMEKVGPPGGGEAVTLLRGPALVQQVTGDAKDLLNGIIAIFNSGDKDPRMPDRYGNVHTPLPDDVSNTPSGVITAQDLKGLLAKLGSKITPTGDDSAGGSGPINTGANGTGKLGSQATFTPDSTVSTTVSISARDLAALAIRLTSKFTATK